MSWFDEGSSGSPVDVPAMMDSSLATAVWEIVQAGAMVSFGTTSDGGALGVTVTLDGRWRRQYGRTTEDLEAFLLDAHQAVTEEVARSAAPSGDGKRSRRSRAR